MSEPAPYPAWFFERDDPTPDDRFYAPTRLVTHIDDAAIAAVGELYAELVVLGMNAAELAANPVATERVVQDLNLDPRLPFADASFDAVLCCVSVDYLVRPVEVLAEAARVLRPGGPVVLTFSNRCFPTKAVHGWLATDDAGRCALVADYLRRAGGFEEPEVSLRTPERRYRGDPLYAVVARRR